MEKAENVKLQKVQNEEQGEPSPNTKRRLKLHLRGPKLHINIPFFKHHHHHDLSPEDEVFSQVSHSLPSESHMPSNIRDRALYHDCEDLDTEPDNDAENNSSTEDPFLLEKVDEDEPESEKHQSDLEENEKDTSDSEPEKQASETPADKDSGRASLPVADECCLKSCLKKTCQGRPRSSTYPGSADCLEARFKRHVSFSPDTVEPTTRNCKYREWIERKCPKGNAINIKHEKRKCQLQQMRKVNISDYLSKNYGAAFFSPVATFGGDMLM